VVASALGRALLCPFLARDIHSLLLFPEAFAMLVLSKVYVVTKGALVPEMAALGMLDSATGTTGTAGSTGATGTVGSTSDPSRPSDPADGEPVIPPASAPLARGPDPTPPYGMPLVRLDDPGSGVEKIEPDLATLNARLGLLASLSGFAFALPAVAILKLGGSDGASAVLWVLVVVFIAAAVAGARLPVPFRRSQLRRESTGRSGRRGGSAVEPAPAAAPAVQFAPDVDDSWREDAEDLAALRPLVDTEVLLALMPVSILKALVGFTTFLFAFDLRREGAATWWFGFVLGAFTAGALIGVLLVARIRRVLTEQQMLTGSLWLVAGVTGLGALYTARWFWAVVALAVGLAMAVAKPSFDALVQRHVRESDQGRAFARNETRFQIMWVAGSFVPVVLSLPAAAGNLVMAVVAATGALSYMSSRRGRRTRTAPA
jgi:hypothetical protein